MNNRISKLLILGIVSVSIALLGCKKNETVKNNFTFNGSKSILSYCALDYKGVTTHIPLTFNYELLLATSGISYDETSKEYTGIGNTIKLRLYSADPLDMLPGLYTFDAFSSKDSLTVDLGSININYNFATGVSDETNSFKNGIIDVSRRGNIYNLEFEFYTNDDIPIKGFYNGQIEIHDALIKK